MTIDGGTNPSPHWDDARIALGRVAELMRRQAVSPGDLRAVEGWDSIPTAVQEALVALGPEEQQIVKDFVSTLSEHHFYIENGEGGLRYY
jgi:hypothetical protein